MRGAELDRLDQRREAVRVLRETEVGGYVRGTACARLIPSNDRELVGQRSELGLPDAAVLPGSVHKHQRQSFTDALVRDLEVACRDDVHGQSYTLLGIDSEKAWLSSARAADGVAHTTSSVALRWA